MVFVTVATGVVRCGSTDRFNQEVNMQNNYDPERGQWTSASSAEYDKLCPGRHLAQQKVPRDGKRSPDADHGTAIHLALSKNDSAGLTLEQTETFDACQKIANDCLKRFFGEAQITHQASEVRLWSAWGGIINGQIVDIRHSGKLDRLYISGSQALICEFKTLAGDVPSASSNLQLRDQAVLVWGGSAKPAANGLVEYVIKEIGCVVIQPFVTHSPEIFTYGESDLLRATIEMQERVSASNDPQSPRIAGETQCKFCRAALYCPEAQAYATRLLPVSKVILDVPAANWTPEQCGQFLNAFPMAETWLNDSKESIRSRMVDGMEVPGYGLKDGNEVRHVVNAQQLFNRFASLDDIATPEQKLELFMSSVEVGVGGLKTAVNKLTGYKGKKLESAVDKMLEGVVQLKKNRPSIVKRKAK